MGRHPSSPIYVWWFPSVRYHHFDQYNAKAFRHMVGLSHESPSSQGSNETNRTTTSIKGQFKKVRVAVAVRDAVATRPVSKPSQFQVIAAHMKRIQEQQDPEPDHPSGRGAHPRRRQDSRYCLDHLDYRLKEEGKYRKPKGSCSNSSLEAKVRVLLWWYPTHQHIRENTI
jgi:hypothetical protein